MFDMFSLAMLWIKTEIFSLEEKMNFTKGRSLFLFPLPTFVHKIPHLTRASVRRWEKNCWPPLAPHIWQVRQDFGITLTLVWLFPGKCQDFPQCNTEGPDVCFGGKLTLQRKVCKSVVNFLLSRYLLPTYYIGRYLSMYAGTYQQYWFPGHPSNWKHTTRLSAIVVVLVHRSAHSEIADFDLLVFPYKTVSGS